MRKQPVVRVTGLFFDRCKWSAPAILGSATAWDLGKFRKPESRVFAENTSKRVEFSSTKRATVEMKRESSIFKREAARTI